MEKYVIQLEKLKQEDNFRTLPDGRNAGLIDLCSNDYLGINSNIVLRQNFFEECGHHYAFGSGASRLLGTKLNVHAELEGLISESYQTEAALVFNSGYHANTGILSSITGKKDLIIADKFIHASVIDGARLSDAGFMRYRHLDYDHLERLLIRFRDRYEKVFLVSESVFSMDGDVVDIKRMVELKERYNCCLYIDEAHALGVRGEKGLGCVEEQDCMQDVDFIVGAMGKALASVGAFVACNQVFKEYLVNHSRSFIFSTALPPVNMAWSVFVFKKMQSMKKERMYLKSLSLWFAGLLKSTSESHIVPFLTGSNALALAQSQKLSAHGIHALPVRYPTVPKGTARLRFSLNDTISREQLLPVQQLLKCDVR